VAVLSTAEAAANYWHWMLELLPRFHLLEKAGFSPSEVDCYLVNHTGQPFQLETLTELGIRRDQIVRTDGRSHYEVERMVVSSLKLTQLHVAPWACAFLRTLSASSATAQKPRRRLYISRAAARFRRLLNEDELFSQLQEFGFERIHCEALTAREQRELFRAAELIIGPHGAALTNLVFCEPGTRIVELFPPDYVDLSMWPHISHTRLCHYYLRGEARRESRADSPVRTQDFTVSSDVLLKFVKTECAHDAAPRTPGFGAL
jgi:capsular polysaccharide biosynthesis protein